MRCSLDAAHLARRRCEECGLAFCRLCDAVVHDDPARAPHRRHPLGHVAWDVSGSPSLVERLERALAGALAGLEPPESEPVHGSWEPEGVVLPSDSTAAKVHGGPAGPAVDRATRARILEQFEATRRRKHAPPVPAT